MKLDDLKAGWESEVAQTGSTPDLSRVIKSLETETNKIDRSVKRRDLLEISVALLLIPIWSWKLFYSASVIQSLGLWVAILACLYIPYRLVKARLVDSPTDESILAFLKVEKTKLENQKKLLESIAVWYISPLLSAIVLITTGARVDESGIPQISNGLILYYGFCILLMAGIYLLNRRAAKRRFSPLLDRVNQRIDELTGINKLSE